MYKLFVCLIFCLNINQLLHSQDYSFLKKYSYLLETKGPDGISVGTCFFYKTEKHTYLLSNYHCLTGMNTMGGPDRTVDTILVKYRKANSDSTKFIVLDMTKQRVKFKKIYFNERPDFFSYWITKPEDFNVNYINDLIIADNSKNDPKLIVSYGFTTSLDHKKINQSFLTCNYDSTNFTKLKSYMYSLNPNDPKSNIDSYVDKAKMINNLLSFNADSGRSGSPVFAKDIIYDHGKMVTKYVFYGIILANNKELKKAWVVKREEIIKVLGQLE